MEFQSLPKKQGLYDPQFEHDACGIGFVVNIKGIKSHALVRQGIEILINLTHRGGCGSEHNTGDGAGLLIQLPHKFFKKVSKDSNIDLPKSGDYGVGMLFLPQNEADRNEIETEIEKIVLREGQKLLGWRNVPIDSSMIGKTSKAAMPYFKQIFIEKNENLKSEIAFERKLYAIRKSAEKFSLETGKHFYAASFSSKTIVYKGMLTASQVDQFYIDLKDEDLETALSLVHSRYSTNTFPSWERAHPNRYVIHNGEINTLRGNVNWMKARESLIKTDIFGTDVENIFPIINPEGSDSAMFDNCLEFLALSGRSIEHSALMMIPEPWSKHESMEEKRKSFYEYHSCIMEPWDGPASIAFTDGTKIGAVLDRNGLRPSRYYVTKDDTVIMASEVGVLDLDPSRVLYKERLHPGRTLLIDTKEGKIIEDNEIKEKLSNEHPYKEWIEENMLDLDHLKSAPEVKEPDSATVFKRQKAFGYTFEELKKIISPMAKDGIDPIGAMGYDSPLAVLSEKPQLLYNYFKQLFAQVTNPPIDAIREELITASETYIGSEGSLIEPKPSDCRQIKVPRPVIDNDELAKLIHLDEKHFKTTVLPILFKASEKGKGLESALDELFSEADKAIEEGSNILILSDRGIDKENAAIPALLATGGLHHHLIRNGKRTKVSIILETGEPREVHQFALLVGYGASAINPYLAFETIDDLIKTGKMTETDHKTAVGKYIKASTKGVVKVLSKMGISTIQSYQGAQIFEAIGLNSDLIDKYFTSTASRIGGIGLDIVAEETLMRHEAAFDERFEFIDTLENGGTTVYRSNDEYHLFNPESVYKLQQSCKKNDYNEYKEYANLINNQTQKHCTLRGLMDFEFEENPIPIEEVESVESICKRFKTGAMSYGSISKEAHESLAIAMNRIGGKSNTGEGGEDIDRFKADENGDSRCSAIKQVASGRFGVTSHYLVNAKEIQIKMAQGAKPGEGGQLPGKKVYPWVANTRGTTTGVGLISPPPHHDIYSIEDLAELVHDLKNANRDARICVKLVSEVGVGTVAAGVAKGRADVVLISGFDGGTGASPRTSIKHAGLPWELGVAETHQTLVLNNLRSRIVVETDGKLLTGRDVTIAALLGAEEYGFATAPLVVLGCVMMRVCNLDTCPVGVATQNPKLRSKFNGSPDHVVNYMHFIAQEMREYMAKLGFRTVDEMIGRTDKLKKAYALNHWKAKGLDFSNIFHKPENSKDIGTFCQIDQDHELNKSVDITKLLDICKPAIESKEKVKATLPIKNINRVVGTILGSEISKKYGGEGLPENTIELKFEGSAGQSYAAFVPKGVYMELEGDANDYFAKGLSGGKLVVYPPKVSSFVAEENIIIGNVAFYGATNGEAYIRGIAGERFCVRNSGAQVVVEGVGDHACEYMTGGISIILGKTGRNFAAGMSGGIAYIYDEDGTFSSKCNTQMVNIKTIDNIEEINILKNKIKNHMEYTESAVAKKILNNWEISLSKFVKVLPKDYERMLNKIKEAEGEGLSGDEALMAAFIANNNDMSRVGGN